MADRILDIPEGIPSLNTYYFYLTGGCNLACQHCWITPSFQLNGGTGGHLGFDLFALAIEEGIPLGLTNVKLTGGEPFLHPDLIKIIDLVYGKGLRLTMETNGTLLTKSIADYIKRKSIAGFISVSLDGASAEVHDRFRGVKGCFEKAVQGIRYLVDAGFRPQVIMSIHAGNIDDIEPLVRLAENLGAGSVKFNIVNPVGRGELMNKQGRVLDLPRLLDLGKWIEKDFQKSVSIPMFYSWPMAFHSLRRLASRNNGNCGIRGILGILSTGHLAMCGIGVNVPELVYGQIGQDRIRDVWINNPELVKLRQDLPEKLEGVCSTCFFKEICLGNCVAENYFMYGRLTAPTWFCQKAAEMGLFPLTRQQPIQEKGSLQDKTLQDKS